MSKQIRVSNLAYMYLEMEAAKSHRSIAGQVDEICGLPPYKKGKTPEDEKILAAHKILMEAPVPIKDRYGIDEEGNRFGPVSLEDKPRVAPAVKKVDFNRLQKGKK